MAQRMTDDACAFHRARSLATLRIDLANISIVLLQRLGEDVAAVLPRDEVQIARVGRLQHR